MKASLETPLQHDYREGPITEAIEKQRIMPSDAFLWAAGVSILASLTLKILGRSHTSLFVGQWAPTFLLLAVYNKMTKGSTERQSLV